MNGKKVLEMPKVAINRQKYVKENISKLILAKLAENDLHKIYLSDVLGVTKSIACRKVKNNAWTLEDIITLTKHFSISQEELAKAFELKAK